MLTEAAVVERLRREFRLPAHAQLVYGHALFEQGGREALRCVDREYIAAAHRASLLLLLTSLTRRSNQETLAAAGREPRSFAREWVAFLRTHPENLLAGLATEANRDRASLSRLQGIQANASRLSPSELDGSEALRSDGSDALARGMAELRTRHGLHIFGGCCGTDAAYLEAIGAAVTAAHA